MTEMATRITIPISGMHCAACQSRVQSALAESPGVTDASVSLMLNNATVTYDERATQPDALVETIRSTGYDASLPAPDVSGFDEQAKQDEAQGRELRALIRKTSVSLAVAALLMTVPMFVRSERLLPWLAFA